MTSPMTMKTIAVVYDNTGKQGDSVAKALLGCEEFVVRVIPSSDLTNGDSLQQKLQNVHACFVSTTTDFDDPQCMDAEIERGKLIANACKSENVNHVIYSSQLHTNNICSLMARHMVAKAEVAQYMRDVGLPLTSIIMPVFYEDLCDLFKPTTADGRNYDIEIPMGQTSLDTISLEDIGPVVVEVLRRRETYLHKTLSVGGDKLTVREMAQILTKYLLPRSFRDKQMTTYDFHTKRSRDLKGGADWANMFQFFQRVDQRHNMTLTKQLNPKTRSFDDWVKENISQLASVFKE